MTVVPIPNIKNTNKADEHKPVNMTNSMDKILQTIVKNEIEEHLENKHSCETAINLIISQWKSDLVSKT